MAQIVLKNLTKVYSNKFKALENLDLEIRDKEFLVLVGPSGCGKSTVLRIIAGLEDITGGELYINDVKVNDFSPQKRNISMVFQNYALYPHMNVYENIAFSLKLKKINKKEIKEKIEKAAKTLEIDDILYKKPSTLSGGQKQRVALGRAIVREPEVFLFDEPLSNIDAKLRTQMRIELIRLHKQLQTTFVYVTHDQTEAMTMGERIVVMRNGMIQQIDTPQNLYNNPCNMFTAGFIGVPQMNFINTAMQNSHDGLYLSMKENQTIKYNLNKKCSDAIPVGNLNTVMGIRAENLYLMDDLYVDSDDIVFENCKVEAVELLGAEKLLYVDWDGEKLVSKISNDADLHMDDKVEVYCRTKDVHIFKRDTEEKIYLS